MGADQRAADHAQIVGNLYRYAQAIDGRDWDRLDSIFTPDAVIHYAVEHGVELPLAQMKGWLARSLSIFARTHHVITNPLVEIEGDAAGSTCYLTATHVQRRRDGKPHLFTQGGVYDDTHVRTAHGWRISRRILHGVYTDGFPLAPDQVESFGDGAGR